ncbi:MAG: hypothetical protein ABI191_05260, partial [Rhizomicrobium sp.]
RHPQDQHQCRGGHGLDDLEEDVHGRAPRKIGNLVEAVNSLNQERGWLRLWLAGAADHIVKPFTPPDQVLARASQILGLPG